MSSLEKYFLNLGRLAIVKNSLMSSRLKTTLIFPDFIRVSNAFKSLEI